MVCMKERNIIVDYTSCKFYRMYVLQHGVKAQNNPLQLRFKEKLVVFFAG